MGGVSIDTGNPDLTALLGSKDDFSKRLEELKRERAAHEKAVTELKLGQSAKDANDQAHRLLNETKDKRAADLAALEAEITSSRATFLSWLEQTKQDTLAMRQDAARAKEEAEANRQLTAELKADAQKLKVQSQVEYNSLLEKAQNEAAGVVALAKAEAARLTKEADKAKAEAVKARSEADAMKADLTKRIDTLQTAASAVLK